MAWKLSGQVLFDMGTLVLESVSHCAFPRSAFYLEGTISKGTFWLDRFWEVALPKLVTLKQNSDPTSTRVGPFEAKQCWRRPLWSRTIRECHSSFQMFRCAHNVQRKTWHLFSSNFYTQYKNPFPAINLLKAQGQQNIALVANSEK